MEKLFFHFEKNSYLRNNVFKRSVFTCIHKSGQKCEWNNVNESDIGLACLCIICHVCKMRLYCWMFCEINPYFVDKALANTWAATLLRYCLCLFALALNPHCSKHTCMRTTCIFSKTFIFVFPTRQCLRFTKLPF